VDLTMHLVEERDGQKVLSEATYRACLLQVGGHAAHASMQAGRGSHPPPLDSHLDCRADILQGAACRQLDCAKLGNVIRNNTHRAQNKAPMPTHPHRRPHYPWQGSKKVDQNFQEWLARQMGQATFDAWRGSSVADFLAVMNE
jgi:hypothetical protein